MEQNGFKGKNYMDSNNKKNSRYLFSEKIIFLLLRIVLFIAFLVILFKNVEIWWIFALTTGALLVLVMFKKLDFFEIVRVFKAGVNFKEESTDTGKSFTPEKIIKDLKQLDSNKTIKIDLLKDESSIKN